MYQTIQGSASDLLLAQQECGVPEWLIYYKELCPVQGSLPPLSMGKGVLCLTTKFFVEYRTTLYCMSTEWSVIQQNQ